MHWAHPRSADHGMHSARLESAHGEPLVVWLQSHEQVFQVQISGQDRDWEPRVLILYWAVALLNEVHRVAAAEVHTEVVGFAII